MFLETESGHMQHRKVIKTLTEEDKAINYSEERDSERQGLLL